MSYCFPQLDTKDCLSYMREILSDINDNDFAHPQRMRWQKLYGEMLCLSCLNFTPDMITQTPMTEGLAHPELYEDSLPLAVLLKAIHGLMSTCGFQSFKLSDILYPKPKRLLKICSAFINYMRFQSEREAVFHELRDRNDMLKEQRESLLRENDEQKQLINSIKGRQAETQMEVEVVNAQSEEFAEKVATKTQNVNMLQMQSEENKTNISTIRSNNARNKDKLAEFKENNDKLSSKIVQSPDRMKGEMEKMENKVVQVRNETKSFQQKQKGFRRRFEQQQQREAEMDKALQLVEAVGDEIDKHKQALIKISELQEGCQKKRSEMKQLDTEFTLQSRQLSTKQEKLEKLTMLHNMKIGDRRSTLEQFQNEYEAEIELRGEKYQKIKQLSNHLQNIQDRIHDENLTQSDNMAVLQDKYREMLSALDMYHSRLGEAHEKHMNGL